MKIIKLLTLSFITAVTYIPFGFIWLVYVDVIKTRKNEQQKKRNNPLPHKYCGSDGKQKHTKQNDFRMHSSRLLLHRQWSAN